MKIIKLTAENVKKLTAVQISPDGNLVQITGKNGQGKTSVLDALWWVFTGTANVQAQPIRNGAETARIEVEIGAGGATQFIVERRFTEAGSYLSVKTADGAKYPSPQKMLDDLLGALTFDPLAFMRRGPKEQFEVLRHLVALDCDPDALDKANKEDFDKRTGINRDAKAKRAQAAAIVVPEGLPADAVDESALLDTITEGAELNADIERRKSNRESAAALITVQKVEAMRLRTEAEKLIEQATVLEAAAAEKQKKLDEAPALPDPVDLSVLRAQLDAAKAVNAGIEAGRRQATIHDEAVALEKQSEDLTNAIEARNAKKREAIEKAQMPVPGLSFGDGVVTFNGLPLDQASDAEQLTVSMSIAAALNPKLRVLRIRDGSLLDDDAMKRLADFADERDMQVWIERVDGSGTVGFVMEDGHVKGQEAVAAEPKAAAKPSSKKKAAEPV